MDTAIPAFIVVFTALLAIGSFAQITVDSQDRLSRAQVAQAIRLREAEQTQLTVDDAQLLADGATLTLHLKNTGGVTLAGYDGWDVFLSYQGEAGNTYHRWVPPGAEADTWSVAGIYVDPERGIREAHDRDNLNPGEVLALQATLTDPVQPGTTLTVVVATPIGFRTMAYTHRNAPPTLVVNDRVVLAVGETMAITPVLLAAADVDHLPEQVQFVIEAAPTAGDLSLPDGFTQADIEAGALAYTHTAPGYGTDSMTFSLTDGIDTVGPFTLEIKISAPPVLIVHTGLTVLNGGSAALTPLHLTAIDPDDTAENVRFQAQTAPLNGTLSMTSFTQADLVAGRVAYTHSGVGSGADSFQFTVTDGVNTIGNYHFEITVK